MPNAWGQVISPVRPASCNACFIFSSLIGNQFDVLPYWVYFFCKIPQSRRSTTGKKIREAALSETKTTKEGLWPEREKQKCKEQLILPGDQSILSLLWNR